jgi:hypothetical protein
MGSPLLLMLLMLGPTEPNPFLLGNPCQPDRPEYGPAFVLPVELAQGATAGRGSPAPYAASLRFHPTYVLDRKRQIRVAATLGSALVNPDLELLLGGRITTSVFELNAGPLRGIGAHLGLEGLYGTSGRGLLGAVLIADGGGILQVTVRVEPDVTNGATLLELGLGTHLDRGRSPRFTPVPSTPEAAGYADSVRKRMTLDTRAVVGELRFRSVGDCEAFLQSARAFLQRRDPRPTTVRGFRQALTAHGLGRLETDMAEPPPPPSGVSEAVTVEALYRGLGDGISTPSER